MVNINSEPNGSKDVEIAKANGAIIGADSFELAIEYKVVNSCFDTGPQNDKTELITERRKVTTNGTNRFR